MEYRETVVDVRDTKIQLLEGGSGPDLLYLHSAGGELLWLPFFDHLAQDFTVHVPAHPGFAASEGLERIDSISDLAFHTVDLMDVLGLHRPSVVGLSLGGWLAAELAVHQRERLSKLVLIDPVGIYLEGYFYPDIFAVPVGEFRSLIFADPDSDVARTFVPDDPTPEMLEAILKAQQATARVGWDPYLHDPKLLERLYRVNVPTAIIWGGKDRLCDPAYAQAWHDGIAGSELTILDDCGHAPPFEKPDEVARIVTDFLKRT